MSDDEDTPEDFPSLDELVGSFMEETSLWPVLVVVIASAGALGAAVLVLTGIDHNPFAAAALVLIFGMTVDVFIQARRKAVYKNLARLAALIWCAAIALAGLAIWTGIAY